MFEGPNASATRIVVESSKWQATKNKLRGRQRRHDYTNVTPEVKSIIFIFALLVVGDACARSL